jgi:hypothetical protein
MLPLLLPILVGGLIGGGLNAIGYAVGQRGRGDPISSKVALASFLAGFAAGAMCSLPFGQAVIAAGGTGAWTYLAGVMALASMPPRIVENSLAKRRWSHGLVYLATLSAISAPIMCTVLVPVVAKIPGLQAAAEKAASNAIENATHGLESVSFMQAAAVKTAAQSFSEESSRALETWGGSLPQVTNLGRELLVKGTGVATGLGSMLNTDESNGDLGAASGSGMLPALQSVSEPKHP